MRTSIYAMVLMLIAGISSGSAQQGVKIGYVDAGNVVASMPATKYAQSELTSYQERLLEQIAAKENRLREQASRSTQDYQAGRLTPAEQEYQQQQLQDLTQEVEASRQQAQILVVQKEQELMAPIYKQVSDAIRRVAVRYGYSHVLNSNAGGASVLLYARDEDDVTRLVMGELGL